MFPVLRGSFFIFQNINKILLKYILNELSNLNKCQRVILIERKGEGLFGNYLKCLSHFGQILEKIGNVRTPILIFSGLSSIDSFEKLIP